MLCACILARNPKLASQNSKSATEKITHNADPLLSRTVWCGLMLVVSLAAVKKVVHGRNQCKRILGLFTKECDETRKRKQKSTDQNMYAWAEKHHR